MTGKKVLIVEDELDQRTMLSRLFGRLGFSADGASDGSEGIAQATRNGYDLIVLDSTLPDCTQLEALSRIKRERPYTPIIVISSPSYLNEEVETTSIGGCECIIKPFRIEQVRAVTLRVIEKSSLKEAKQRLKRLLAERFPPVPLREVERAYIERILDETNWNQTHAAMILDIDRKTLRNRMREFGMRKPDSLE